jgi:hypothetical protein
VSLEKVDRKEGSSETSMRENRISHREWKEQESREKG